MNLKSQKYDTMKLSHFCRKISDHMLVSSKQIAEYLVLWFTAEECYTHSSITRILNNTWVLSMQKVWSLTAYKNLCCFKNYIPYRQDGVSSAIFAMRYCDVNEIENIINIYVCPYIKLFKCVCVSVLYMCVCICVRVCASIQAVKV